MMKNNNRFFFFCAVLSFMNAMFVSAADQVITWKKEAQEVDLYSDEALTIQWTGTHDVWLHDAAGCTGGASQKAQEADSNWSAMAGNLAVGTHYFSCRVGNHCEENMTLKVTSYAGSRPAATTTDSPCDASAVPANGAVGDCTSTLASGSTCQPTCNTGYTVSGTSSCLAGTLTAATCVGNLCDTSAAPANGAIGDCTSTLASGSTCQPTCDDGYTVSGTSSCLAGTFTSAECSVAPSPPPPSPPPPAAAAVQAEMQLTGYSAAEFDDDKKTNFKTGMAKYLGVDSAAITITSVVDVTAGRRKLSAVDSVLKVEFTVEATTFSDTTALETKLVVTDVTTMETELISAGLVVTNIVAPTTITALAPPPSPPPSPPASASPLLSVVKLIVATAALAFFAC